MKPSFPEFRVSINGQQYPVVKVNYHFQDQPFPGDCSYIFLVKGEEAVKEFLLSKDDFNEMHEGDYCSNRVV